MVKELRVHLEVWHEQQNACSDPSLRE
jgi:hypothetical protein